MEHTQWIVSQLSYTHLRSQVFLLLIQKVWNEGSIEAVSQEGFFISSLNYSLNIQKGGTVECGQSIVGLSATSTPGFSYPGWLTDNHMEF
ncbi:hypothetical protein Aconfl_24930 [Algoriphagus confluentis]|uniref:Uncharacterized protein n=1 Tax=Algoriphagus confluentis TaxID=1697556 RepID=A0ABQ6PRI9_9BACT|nr:hypothetical protein Aconfl_24930 [Algoriphagus confluentis]